ICAVAAAAERAGVAGTDVATGELRLTIARLGEIEPVLARLTPREIVVPAGASGIRLPLDRGADGALVTEREPWEFDPSLGREQLTRQYGVISLDGLGVGESDALAVGAAGALMRYLREMQPGGLPQMARPVI